MEKVRPLLNKKQWIKLTHLLFCLSYVTILSKYPSVNSSPLDNRAHKKTNVLSWRSSFFERLRNLGFGGNCVVMKVRSHDWHDFVAERYMRLTWRSQNEQIGPSTVATGVVQTTTSDAKISNSPCKGHTRLFENEKSSLEKTIENLVMKLLTTWEFQLFLESTISCFHDTYCLLTRTKYPSIPYCHLDNWGCCWYTRWNI
jgi:hypothetical protein